MIAENALVIYKGKPALVKEKIDGKFTVSLQDGEQIKVRDKDIEMIHPGPVKDFNAIKDSGISETLLREAWELLSDEGSALSLKDFAAFVFNNFTPSSAYASYVLLKDGLYFSGTIEAIAPRSKNDVTAEELKRTEKQRESGERVQFLERLKVCLKKPPVLNTDNNPMLADDVRFIQDVEALAFGKSIKSRTMKDLGLGETPEDAHSLLLKTGFWTGMVNPHPHRFGVSLSSAGISPDPPVTEDRKNLCYLTAFAIDSPWSYDPDDAVSIETPEMLSENDSASLLPGQCFLYVHIADLASSVTFDSPAEKEARDRGATIYLPEGAVRMLAEDFISMFALGLSEKSIALTFKIKIDETGAVIDTEIFPSVISARRITYEEVDKKMDEDPVSEEGKTLRSLYDLSQKIHKRRISQGAVNIELPDIHITVNNDIVEIEPEIVFRSSSMIRECMIAAGEGVGTWAASRGLAFPYISQEVEIQGKIPGGLSGSVQLRRCMRPRVLSIKPARHQGLGLDTYTQVTSPLRRYTDLLAHIQIRSFLRGEKTLGADEVSARLGYCEAAVSASVQAERASNNHWLMIYLSDKKDSIWDAVALEKKGNRWAVIIPSLALETYVALQKDVSPNDDVKLILKSVNVAKGEAVFVNRNE
ncbi:MAG: ribonuclease catalytic domain-containing protein [Treponema sp.]|nr:ribonuclease catalytic domain-containing protein [Treponema sp.]